MTKKSLRKLLILSEKRPEDYGYWLYTYYHPVEHEYDFWSVSESGDSYTDSWNNNKDRLECAYKGLQLYFKTIGVELK